MHNDLIGQTELPGTMLLPHNDQFISVPPSRNVVPTSLDTFQLWTDQFTFPSRWELPFTVIMKGSKSSRALYVNAQGVTIYGNEARAQLGPLHIRLAPLPYRPALHLTITGNPADILWGNNVRPVSQSDFVRAMERVDAILKAYGIRVRLGLMLPKRLDWRRDYAVRHPIELYIAYFKSVRPTSCTPGIGYDHPSSICYGWKKERVRFYDKPQQIQSEIRRLVGRNRIATEERNTKIQVLKDDHNYLKSQGKNVLRAECETHPDATLRRSWGFNTLNELSDNYSVGERIFDDFLANKVLPSSGKIAEAYSSLHAAQHGLLTQESLRVPIEKIESYLIARGANSYQRSMTRVFLYDELKGTGMSRSRLSTLKKKIDEGRPYVHLSDGVTFRDVAEELESILFPFGRPPVGKEVKSSTRLM